MAELNKRPSWMIPAVIGAFILAFIAIALVGGSLSRPGGRNDASSPKSAANGAAPRAVHVTLPVPLGG